MRWAFMSSSLLKPSDYDQPVAIFRERVFHSGLVFRVFGPWSTLRCDPL